ncbi:nucleotide sugar dehydrogenase [Prochlorococcus marinus XMU1412]|uniref:nucleotide sugar dehydrogenase n=1 Tax=Prochlorococcus marinus TaxID=1219 RepID=UPI001ADC8018|nr:nucleotide sugar dehydrogenase [Prochlorococcus marinus]MBO8240492.1 nucleotide sugar dehydrogenase [Prochlorococcus marinus XMU1412]MBW3071726.1 nucleotide sugar dehydrogenase [Prochlorococcus marinus str. MU1412]
MQVKNICCIGAGYVGGPTMAVIANKCPHIEVNVVDVNRERIEKWNSDNLNELPVFEPGLSNLVKKCRGVNLNFSYSVGEKISNADMIFISVNTPTKKKGIGAGKASDLKWVEACAREVATYSKGHTIVVEKSTLPVRTAEVIKSILSEATISDLKNNATKTFDVLSNPEFLAEGTAINDLINPDRVLIGGDNGIAIDSLSEIYKNWVPNHKIITTNLWSSELAKLTANAFLAQRISSINSVSAICEATGADIREVSKAIGLDSRIGPKFLNAGPGFGGSCFKKDILNLVYLSDFFGLKEVSSFWESVVSLNNWQQHRISKLIVKKLFGTLTNKKIVVLGFAFKANTNDTRESPAINICKELLEEGAFLVIHDPKVSIKQINIDLNLKPLEISNRLESNTQTLEGKWSKAFDLEKSFIDADAVLILTEWDNYKHLDWKKISKLMRKPSWLFDTRSMIDPEEFSNTKINFWRVGDGT